MVFCSPKPTFILDEPWHGPMVVFFTRSSHNDSFQCAKYSAHQKEWFHKEYVAVKSTPSNQHKGNGICYPTPNVFMLNVKIKNPTEATKNFHG